MLQLYIHLQACLCSCTAVLPELGTGALDGGGLEKHFSLSAWVAALQLCQPVQLC